MNIFEAEIAKYERRVARIAANPGSKMLASNLTYYQAELEHNKELLKWWGEGKPFVAIGGPMPTLLHAFSNCRPLNLIRIADRLGTKRAEEACDKVRAMGLPDYACDRTILFMPLAAMMGDIPKPQLIVSHTGACNVANDTHRALAHLLNVPVYTVDVPFEDPHKEHLAYVTKQLHGLIEFMETNLPGAKYDESGLVKCQKYMQRWSNAMHDIYELRKRVPCPDHPRDVFREPLFPSQFFNPELIVQYYESYRDELRDKAQRGWTPVGEEKLRIVWAISGPYGSNAWDYLAERGVSVPLFHYGQEKRTFAMPTYDDVTEFGRKLSPLEEEARMILYNSWGGIGERWIDDTISVCKEFRADGLVQFEQTGCQPMLGLSQLATERVKAEVGIPCWSVEGRMLLGRTEHTEAQFMAGLEAFINLCFERKRGRAS